jgi:hypothetical protein
MMDRESSGSSPIFAPITIPADSRSSSELPTALPVGWSACVRAVAHLVGERHVGKQELRALCAVVGPDRSCSSTASVRSVTTPSRGTSALLEGSIHHCVPAAIPEIRFTRARFLQLRSTEGCRR